MTYLEHIQKILYRVENGQQTDEDRTFLRHFWRRFLNYTVTQ